MLRPAARDEFLDALVDRLASGAAPRPPELSAPRIDRRAARYVAELRHGAESTRFYRDDGDGPPRALVALAPSPFDSEIFEVPVISLKTLEVAPEVDGARLARAVDDAAAALGGEVIVGRVPADGDALGLLRRAGWDAFGTSLLLAGAPPPAAGGRAGLLLANSAEEIDAAARLAGRCFTDTHLSRDPRLDAGRASRVYERWVRAEAARGAVILVRREADDVIGLAVIRDNPLARRLMGIEQWHLHLLAVAPEARGRGLGAKLAAAAFAEAASRGAETIQTGVDGRGLAARRIYERLGLAPVASSVALHRWLTPTPSRQSPNRSE